VDTGVSLLPMLIPIAVASRRRRTM
jgi:hypothetical protein